MLHRRQRYTDAPHWMRDKEDAALAFPYDSRCTVLSVLAIFQGRCSTDEVLS